MASYDPLNPDAQAAPGPKGINRFSAAADEMASEGKQSLDLTMYQASQTDPDRYAKDEALGAEIGVPADVVGRNREDAELQAKNLRVKRFTDTLDTSPSLQEAMRSGNFSKVAWDDFTPLQNIEATMRSLGTRTYLNPLTATIIENPEIGRKTADYAQTGAAGFVQGFGYGARGLAAGFDTVGNVLSYLGPDLGNGNKDPYVRTISDDLRAFSRPVISLGEKIDIAKERQGFDTQVANALGQAGASILVGGVGRLPQTIFGYLQGAGIMDQVAEENGVDGINRDLSVVAGAAITGITERWGLDQLLKAASPEARRTVTGWMYDIFRAAGAEGVQEFAEQLGQNITTKALLNPDAEIFDGIFESGAVGFTSGGIIRAIVNAVVPGRQMLEGQQRGMDGAADGLTVAKLVADTQASKLNERSPQQFQQFMKSAAEANNRENVYISAEAVQKLNQSGVPLDEFFQEVPEAREQFEEALATGGDLVLPTEKFVPFVAKTETLNALAQEARFTADALPASQVAEINQRIDELRRESDLALEAEDREISPALDLYEEVRRQIRDAGYTPEAAGYQAALVRDFFEQRAAEQTEAGRPTDALQLYRSYGVDIRGPQAERVNLESLGFLFNDVQIQELEEKVSTDAKPFVRDAIAVKRALATRGRQYDRNNIRDLTDILGYRPLNVFDAIDRAGGLSTGLTEQERQTLLQTPAARRKKGSIYNYYPEETRRAFGDDVRLLRRYTRSGGQGLDDFAQALSDAGILPAGTDAKTLDLDAVRDIITRQAAGEQIIPERDRERVDAVVGVQEQLQQGADNAGITPEMSVEEIAERLAETYGAGDIADGDTLYQALPRFQTQAFQDWFADSKVVDGQGVPLVVYHGTTSDFDTFSEKFYGEATGTGDMGDGFYFTDNPDVASEFAGRGAGANVMPVYLAIQNPATNEVINSDEVQNALGDEFGFTSAKEVLQGMGYDGIIYTHANGVKEYVVFENNQIKSTFNRGTFSLQDPRVLYQNTNQEVTLEDLVDGIKNDSPGIQIEVSQQGDIVTLSKISIPEGKRSQGAGRKAMLQLTNWADKNGKTLALTPTDDFGSSKSRLTDFYKSLGFVNNKGSAKRFEVQQTMVREPKLYQDSNRGSITLGETRTLIELGQKADLSTFLHEAGHLFVKVTRDIATGPNAPARTVEIYRAMEKFVGAPENGIFSVEQEEKLARGFEAYLRTGKAPSLSLREAFRAFQSWLVRIYRNIRQLNVTLTPEITATFDRMLASEEAIDANARRYEFEADPAIMALLTKAERADYVKQSTDAKERGRERLLAEMLQQKYRESKEWYKNTRAVVRDEQERVVNSDGVQRAFHVMTTGEYLGVDPADPGPQPDDMRMDKALLVQRFGPQVLEKLPRGKRAVYKEGGVDPEDVAMMFNISSADELIQRLVNLPPREARIEELTDQVMKQRYGDILTDGTLNREAVAALENDQRGELIARELQVVARQTGDVATPAEVAKQLAEDMINRKKVPLATQYAKYVQAQVTAAKNAGAALAKKQFEKGVSEKRKQLLNHYLYMAARDASQELNADLRFFRRLNTDSARKGIDPDYLEQIYDILGRYNFSTSVPVEFDYSRGFGAVGSKKRQTMEQFIAERQKAGDPITIEEIPVKLRSDTTRGSYKEMTMSEFRGLRDTIRQLAHLGRTKQQLVLGREKRNLEAVTTEVADTIRANGKLTDGLSRRNKSTLRKMGGKYLSSVLHPTTILREMDGFKDLGPAFKHIKGVIDQAVNDKLVPMQREMAERFEKIWEVYSIPERANLTSSQVYINSVDRSFTKMELMTVGFNWGNLSNRQALKEGYGWNDSQVDEMLSKLDKRDWDTIQATWDMLESYWPQVAALEKKRKGVAPKKIAAEPVRTQYGTYKGGYFPLRYDEQQDIRVSEEAPEELMQNFRNGRFVKAQTRNGATIERVGSGGRPVSLDGLGTVSKGLKQTAYDLTMYEAVAYSGKVLTNERVRRAFQDTDNIEYWHALDLWLKDVATGEVRAADFLSTTMRHIRTGFTVSKLAWNLGTVMIQPLGYTQTIEVLGGKYAYLGVRDIMTSPFNGENSAFAKVTAMSSFMRERQNTYNKDISESMHTFRELLLKDAGKLSAAEALFKQTVLRPMASSGFYLLGKSQYIIDVATWSGAYRKGMDQFGGDVEKAVAYADDAVKRAQSSGLFADRSGFERGTLTGSQARQVEFVKAFTTLGSYMITKANIAYEKTKNTDFRSPKKIMGWTMDMTMLFLVEGIAMAALRAQWPDDDESKTLWLGKMLANQVASTMPVAREFASELGGFRGGGPFGSFLKEVGGLATQLQQGEWDAALIKKMNNVAGVMLHLPASQTNVFVDAMFRASEGEDVAPIDYMMWREKD